MLNPRPFAQLPFSILCALLGAGALGVASARAAKPSGNRAAIAFYRHVQAAYRPVHTVVGIRRGFLSYTVSGTVFTYRYGEAPPAGFRPATESLRYLLRNGRITRFIDIAKAAGLPPLTLIQDASGVWGRVSGTCYTKTPGAGNIGGINDPFLGIFGDFQPIRRTDNTAIVLSSYPWGKTGHATETDQISTTSQLMLTERIHVADSTPFTFSVTGLREPTGQSATPPRVAPRC